MLKYELKGPREWGVTCPVPTCKKVIEQEGDVVLLQKTKASPCLIGKVSDKPKWSGVLRKTQREAKPGLRLKPQWFPWVRLRMPPDTMKPGMVARLCGNAVSGKGNGCARGDGSCFFAHSQEEADYWTECVNTPFGEGTLDRIGGELVITDAPGKRVSSVSQAFVTSAEDDSKYTLSDHDRKYLIEYVLGNKKVAEVAFLCDASGYCRRFVEFDKPTVGHQARNVQIMTSQAGVRLKKETKQGSVKIMGGTPGAIPQRSCKAVMVDAKTGEEFEFAKEAGMKANMDFIIKPAKDRLVPEYTVFCNKAGIYTRPAAFQLNEHSKVVYATIDPNPAALKHIKICKTVGTCNDRACTSAHREVEAKRAIEKFARRYKSAAGQEDAQFYHNMLQHEGRVDLLQFTRLCRDFVSGNASCSKADASGRVCTYAHSKEQALDAIDRCSSAGTFDGFDKDGMLDKLDTDLQLREQNLREITAASGNEGGGKKREKAPRPATQAPTPPLTIPIPIPTSTAAPAHASATAGAGARAHASAPAPAPTSTPAPAPAPAPALAPAIAPETAPALELELAPAHPPPHLPVPMHQHQR